MSWWSNLIPCTSNFPHDTCNQKDALNPFMNDLRTPTAKPMRSWTVCARTASQVLSDQLISLSMMYEVSSGFKVLESNMGPYVFVWPIWACHCMCGCPILAGIWIPGLPNEGTSCSFIWSRGEGASHQAWLVSSNGRYAIRSSGTLVNFKVLGNINFTTI